MSEKKLSQKQLKHNEKLQKYYPLGILYSAWNTIDSLYIYANEEEKRALDKLEEEFMKVDNLFRENQFPLKKKGK